MGGDSVGESDSEGRGGGGEGGGKGEDEGEGEASSGGTERSDSGRAVEKRGRTHRSTDGFGQSRPKTSRHFSSSSTSHRRIEKEGEDEELGDKGKQSKGSRFAKSSRPLSSSSTSSSRRRSSDRHVYQSRTALA